MASTARIVVPFLRKTMIVSQSRIRIGPFVQGDTLPVIPFVLVDEQGVAINLTSHSVKFRFRKIGGNRQIVNLSTSCTVTSATAGECTYSPGAADFSLIADYEGELELTDGSSKVQTSPQLIEFAVRAALG